MGLFKEIEKMTEKVSPCRITLYPDACYAVGVRAVLFFSETRVEIRSAEGKIAVWGNRLTVRKFWEGDLWLSGSVTGVERL